MFPTSQSYDAMAVAYRFFSEHLFDDKLPEILISYQRGNYAGFASRARWVAQDQKRVHELAMNPGLFAGRPIEGVLSTLLHEAVHIFQFDYGSPARGKYHNKEFAQMMADVGLICSHDGLPGGKQTGDRMTHYYLWDGPGWKVVRDLIDNHDFSIPWLDRFPDADNIPLLIFDDEHRPRSSSGKVLGDPFDREAWNESKKSGNAIPLPQPGPDDPDEQISKPMGAAVAEGIVNAADRKKAKTRKRASKSTYLCPKPGCNVKIWGKPDLEVGCFCGMNGGAFVLDNGEAVPDDKKPDISPQPD